VEGRGGPDPATTRRIRQAEIGTPWNDRLRQKDNIELTLVEMTTVQQIQALKAGRIDVGFGRLQIDDPEVRQKVLFYEPLLAALPVGHPLQDLNPSLEELVKYPLILFPSRPRPSFADIVLGLFFRHDLKPHVVQETNELQTALSLVASGLGITLVPEQVMNVNRKGIIYTRLADAKISTPVICSRRHGEGSSPLLEEVGSILKKLSHSKAKPL